MCTERDSVSHDVEELFKERGGRLFVVGEHLSLFELSCFGVNNSYTKRSCVLCVRSFQAKKFEWKALVFYVIEIVIREELVFNVGKNLFR